MRHWISASQFQIRDDGTIIYLGASRKTGYIVDSTIRKRLESLILQSQLIIFFIGVPVFSIGFRWQALVIFSANLMQFHWRQKNLLKGMSTSPYSRPKYRDRMLMKIDGLPYWLCIFASYIVSPFFIMLFWSRREDPPVQPWLMWGGLALFSYAVIWGAVAIVLKLCMARGIVARP